MQSFHGADVSALLSAAIGVQRDAFSRTAASFENAGQSGHFVGSAGVCASGALESLLGHANSGLSATLNRVINGRGRVS